MEYVKNTMGIRAHAQLEIAGIAAAKAASDSEQLNASIDYIAMMCDVELPEKEQEGKTHEQKIRKGEVLLR